MRDKQSERNWKKCKKQTMSQQIDKYNTILKNLRKNKPKIEHPESFSDQVMRSINKRQTSKMPGIQISGTSGRWTLFIGFRNAMAVAAIFLVGFFVNQQWEILSKVSRLEQEIQYQKEASITFDKLEMTKTARVKQLLEQKLITNTTELKRNLDGKEAVLLQKSMLNYLLQSLDQLEEENRQLKSQLMKQYGDTLKKYINEKSKTL